MPPHRSELGPKFLHDMIADSRKELSGDCTDRPEAAPSGDGTDRPEVTPGGDGTDRPEASLSVEVQVEVYLYQGDATTADVLDCKKHVSRISSSAMALQHLSQLMRTGGREVDLAALQELCPSQRMICDLQDVDAGTGAETYRLMLQEFKSISAPSWDHAVGNLKM